MKPPSDKAIRDPRVDPKPGDVLGFRKGSFRHIVSTRGQWVVFHSRCGSQWVNSAMRETLEEWREAMKDAEVIHAAD